MNLKKYYSYTFALLLYCGCTTDGGYTTKEEKGYYTQNPYKLGGLELFKKIIRILQGNEVTCFKNKLKDRIPEWFVTKDQKKPYEIWKSFYSKELQPNIINKLKNSHHTRLLEDYYDQLGNLFKDPTEANEKALITAGKALQAQAKLIEAFKASIAEKYATPGKIYLTQSILEYHEFLYFILGKSTSLPKLSASQHNLAKWKKDGHPTGQVLWERITKTYSKLLKNAKRYQYPDNQNTIRESLRLIDDKLADKLCDLSYKDLLETIPHGIDLINNILSEVALEEKDDIELLKAYLRLVPSIVYMQLEKNL